MRKLWTLLLLVLFTVANRTALAADATDEPRPTALTRPAMKILIEDMKSRKPRIPLPELTAEDKENLGERGGGYEGRLRYHYMPGGVGRGGGGGGFGGAGFGRAAGRAGGGTRDPNVSLDDTFKVQLFWIVCRANNCQYCQGHQESKLLRAGQTEDQIYKLDGKWEDFKPTERALFTVAKKLAASPVVLTDAEVDEAVKLAGPRDVVQLVSYTTNRAAFDRITEAVGLPLDK